MQKIFKIYKKICKICSLCKSCHRYAKYALVTLLMSVTGTQAGSGSDSDSKALATLKLLAVLPRPQPLALWLSRNALAFRALRLGPSLAGSGSLRSHGVQWWPPAAAPGPGAATTEHRASDCIRRPGARWRSRTPGAAGLTVLAGFPVTHWPGRQP